LPADESSHGFDNITVGNLSPTLLERYVTAAQKISRLAVGRAQRVPGGDTIRVKPDITQEDRVDGLPLGTRGGTVIRHVFPADAEYKLSGRLADRNEQVEGRTSLTKWKCCSIASVKKFTLQPSKSARKTSSSMQT
jgi:hypothetical protein